MEQATMAVPVEERALAVLTHLSGLSGYLLPFGGVIVPIVIWAVNKESPIISSIAKQALILNVAVYLVFAATWILWITIILIPVALVVWAALGVAAIALPIIGAIKANEGTYYCYPIVGVYPF